MKTYFANETLKQTFCFSVVAIFAFLAAVCLHELGHAFAIYVTEHEIARISFHPFTGAVTSYTTAAGDPTAARLVSAGGVMFGSLFSLLISFPFIFRFRNPWTTPFSMIAVAALAGNGLILVTGAVFSNVSDVIKLLSLGVSKWVLLSSGVLLLLLSLYLFLLISSDLGFGPKVVFRKRCAILCGAIFPYILCILVYNAIFQIERIGSYLIFTLGGSALAVAGVFVCGYWQSRVPSQLLVTKLRRK